MAMHSGLTRTDPQLIDALLLGDQLLSPEHKHSATVMMPRNW